MEHPAALAGFGVEADGRMAGREDDGRFAVDGPKGHRWVEARQAAFVACSFRVIVEGIVLAGIMPPKHLASGGLHRETTTLTQAMDERLARFLRRRHTHRHAEDELVSNQHRRGTPLHPRVAEMEPIGQCKTPGDFPGGGVQRGYVAGRADVEGALVEERRGIGAKEVGELGLL